MFSGVGTGLMSKEARRERVCVFVCQRTAAALVVTTAMQICGTGIQKPPFHRFNMVVLSARHRPS